VLAHSGATIERRYTAAQLPRLNEAGIVDPATVRMSVRFSNYEGHIALNGTLEGSVTMTCQRCMKPAAIELRDSFSLLAVDAEAAALDETTGYEPIVADPARLDVRWLADEQTLLAIPLVPKHENDDCAAKLVAADEAGTKPVGQRPFADLKKLLRDH